MPGLRSPLSNTTAFEKLKDDLAAGGLGLMLENLRAAVAILDGRGQPLGWNQAFEDLQADFSACLVQPRVRRALEQVRDGGEPARFGAELLGLSHDCLLASQAPDRVLFIAQLAGAAMRAPHPAGGDDVDKLKSELTDARQALSAKQKELQAVLAQAEEVSHTDSLTFLPNRRSLLAELQRQVTYAERYGSPLSISMIDIDNFKDINDKYGHPAGDQVLRFIASQMRDRIRQPDVIGRYGGDEFLVILPNTTVNAAADQAARLCQQVAAAPVIAGKELIGVSMSVGITQFQPNSDDWHRLLERADQAMYQAKHSGRGTWAIIKA